MNGTELFLVIKSGVYRHDIVALEQTEAEARCAAENAALKEPDDYHSFEIIAFKVGGNEERPVATFSRVAAGKDLNKRCWL